MRTIVLALVAVAALTAASSRASQASNPPRHAKWHETAAQNVQKSRQYDRLVATNSRFRAYRMKKECGPIKDPALHGDCIASFNTYEVR
jgi:hypothetical protein